jgi:hypothetical protein
MVAPPTPQGRKAPGAFAHLSSCTHRLSYHTLSIPCLPHCHSIEKAANTKTVALPLYLVKPIATQTLVLGPSSYLDLEDNGTTDHDGKVWRAL